jgi:hypothetical protein
MMSSALSPVKDWSQGPPNWRQVMVFIRIPLMDVIPINRGETPQ